VLLLTIEPGDGVTMGSCATDYRAEFAASSLLSQNSRSCRNIRVDALISDAKMSVQT